MLETQEAAAWGAVDRFLDKLTEGRTMTDMNKALEAALGMLDEIEADPRANAGRTATRTELQAHVDMAQGYTPEIKAAIEAVLSAKAGTVEVDHETRELLASEVYHRIPYAGPGDRPSWEPGGNSHKQDEARCYVGTVLTALSRLGGVGAVPAGADHGCIYATVRDAEDERGDPELHIECRMRDGQKGAFVRVDAECEALAHAIASFLSAVPTPPAGEGKGAPAQWPPMRPMSEAPRDGTKVLAETPAGLSIVYWTEGCPGSSEEPGMSAGWLSNDSETCPGADGFPPQSVPTGWWPLPSEGGEA